MESYESATYGDAIAGDYDRLYGGRPDAEPAAAMLCEMARGGRALELGVGTGRIAIPLAARGLEVHGIDASEAMVRRLLDKAQPPESMPPWATSRIWRWTPGSI